VANPTSHAYVPFQDIHGILANGVKANEGQTNKVDDGNLCHIAQYYFDGKGKAIRIRLGLTVADAVNCHFFKPDFDSKEILKDLVHKQRCIAIAGEMIHTASLMHDDVIDKSEERRSKDSVNAIWGQKSSVLSGDYVVAIAKQLVSKTRDAEADIAMNTILHDLVVGEFQQMSKTKDNKSDRFQMYISKTYNKTASLMANSCKAVAILAGNKVQSLSASKGRNKQILQGPAAVDREELAAVRESAFQYGCNVGIAFQLIDDWLDFSSSAQLLGKPAAADLKLGLATAPVLFAAEKYPHLEPMIKRRFCHPGDAEDAFETVLNSNGLEETKILAQKYCQDALRNIEPWRPSSAKSELQDLVNVVVERMT